MRDSSASCGDVAVPEADLPSPVDDGPFEVSRRSFVGRAGMVGVAGAVLASGVLSAPAGAATAAGAKPGLPSARAAQAKLAESRLVDLEIVELAALLQAGIITSVELTTAYLERIDTYNGAFETYGDNGGYNAFVRVARDEALADAKAADDRLKAALAGGPEAPYLCGIPIGVKDSIGLKGRPVQNGTVAFKGNVGLEDAPAMAKLRALGVVFLGHTICSAFSGATTGTFAGNAWDKRYVPGGSSQGSGVAPAARLAAGAIAEETGGSIIYPAAVNGTSGIKPSLGLTSGAGVMPLRPGVDLIGPIARSMRDAALLLNAFIGPDVENDPTTQAQPLPPISLPVAARTGRAPLDGVTIGIPQTDWMVGTAPGGGVGVPPQTTYDADYLAAFTRLRRQLQALGATVIEFPGLDLTDASVNQYHGVTTPLETVAGANITPLAAVTFPNLYEIGFAKALEQFATEFPDTRAPLTRQYAGTATTPDFATLDAQHGGVSNGARIEGQRRRRKLAENYQKALDDAGVDFMLVMTVGAKIPLRGGSYSRNRSYTQVPNILGWPMVSFPIGFGSDAEALPISAQFWGTRFAEVEIVQAAIDYQAAYPEYHTKVPKDPATPITPTARRIDPKVLAKADENEDPLLSNDPVVYEAAMPDSLRPR
jgi:Asp-tRNA(Asn)/Glu-tRNA(Gln) amidotransferase A subunit family amidase